MRPIARWSAVAATIVALVACAPGDGPPAVTTLFVDATSGSDAGPGTAAAPLRTLSAALAIADAGMTIRLAAGTYDEANGETWPMQVGFPPSATPNVPSGMTIVGESGVRLVGPGAGTTAAALAFAGPANVQDVEMEGFERALLAWLPGVVTLTGIRATGNLIDGLLAFGDAEVVAALSTFDLNGLSGVAAFGNAVLDLQGGALEFNRTGLYATDSATVGVLDTRIADNGSTNDESHSGVYAIGDARLTLSGVALEGNALAGVELRGAARVALTDATVVGHPVYGLYVPAGGTAAASLRVYDSDISGNVWGVNWEGAAGGELFMRGTTIHANLFEGVLVYGDPAVVDFGADGEHSGNRFEGNGLYQLLDARPARPAADGIVITVDAQAVLPAGCVMAIDTYHGPYTYSCGGVDAFSIWGTNQRIRVVAP
jgi:hypothetical protein